MDLSQVLAGPETFQSASPQVQVPPLERVNWMKYVIDAQWDDYTETGEVRLKRESSTSVQNDQSHADEAFERILRSVKEDYKNERRNDAFSWLDDQLEVAHAEAEFARFRSRYDESGNLKVIDYDAALRDDNSEFDTETETPVQPIFGPKQESFPSSVPQLGAEEVARANDHFEETQRLISEKWAPVVSMEIFDIPKLLVARNRMSRPSVSTMKHRLLTVEPAVAEKIGTSRDKRPNYSREKRLEYAATCVSAFPHTEFMRTAPPSYGSGLHSLDHAPHVYIVGNNADIATTTGGYGSARANVCFTGGGSWYFEAQVMRPDVRIGITRREQGAKAPVGYNAYGYGLDGTTGNAVNLGRHVSLTDPLEPGDVIGFHVHIPCQRTGLVQRLRTPLMKEGQLFYETENYVIPKKVQRESVQERARGVSPDLLIEGSFCDIYRNGKPAGRLAGPLRDFRPPHSEYEYWSRIPAGDDGMLGYFPVISVQNGGAARLTCGPDFLFPPPPGVKPASTQYKHQIADDFEDDLFNELVFEKIDALLPPGSSRSELPEGQRLELKGRKT